MQRDMDLCREILRQIEESPDSASPTIEVEDRSREEISYHVKLLADAGLVDAGSTPGVFTSETPGGGIRLKGQPAYSPKSLTWKGHEFLDAARDETIWKRAKDRFGKAGGALTYDLLLSVLKEEIRSLL